LAAKRRRKKLGEIDWQNETWPTHWAHVSMAKMPSLQRAMRKTQATHAHCIWLLGSSDVQMLGCSDVRMLECSVAQMQTPHADPESRDPQDPMRRLHYLRLSPQKPSLSAVGFEIYCATIELLSAWPSDRVACENYNFLTSFSSRAADPSKKQKKST